MTTKYKIDIDPKAEHFSKAFKDFYSSHFIDTWGLSRGDVDTYFYSAMTDEEKEIAKRLIRKNLNLNYIDLIKASGDMKDQEALPILYEQLKNTSDLSRQLTIGQAIWKINSDDLYPELLRKLQQYPDETYKEAHFEQVTDLKNIESIEMLLEYLSDEGDFVRHLALSELNFLITGEHSFENKFDRKYFLAKKNDANFKDSLLQNLLRQV